ncbi:hypothetical protein [Hamadaea tsunoensis]|uniref:hypothetical protein n=1 Tax=Hamadaea tsunoensis TaxID=53368 RepID=UPI001B7FB6CA|nr:hypothetical protein [Hamadaea tsunoensis]
MRVALICGRYPDGTPWGSLNIRIRAQALWKLGLHPDQPAARIVGPTPPAWWRADALRRRGIRR